MSERSWVMNVFPCGQETEARAWVSVRESLAIFPGVHLYEFAHRCTFPGDIYATERCKHKLEGGWIYERNTTGTHCKEAFMLQRKKEKSQRKGRVFQGKRGNEKSFSTQRIGRQIEGWRKWRISQGNRGEAWAKTFEKIRRVCLRGEQASRNSSNYWETCLMINEMSPKKSVVQTPSKSTNYH